MDKKLEKISRNILKYNTRRAYFSKFTAAELDYAHGLLRRTQNLDRPVKSAPIRVGHIDGYVICRALWYEMSYNPVRFGTVAPFPINRGDVIFRFCDHPVPENTPGYDIVKDIWSDLITYMRAMPDATGGWNPEIETTDGWIQLENFSVYYKKLTLLRKIIHKIASQNVEDFKHKEYRAEMLNVIKKRHPNGTRTNKPFELTQKPFGKTSNISIAPPITGADKNGAIDDSSHDGEEERIKYEIDEIWKKTNVHITPEEYENKEIEQYQQQCAKLEQIKNSIKGKEYK